MNIKLNNLDLKTFTEQDALDYCLLNNINHDNIVKLMLDNNKLTDISGIIFFKNIEELYLNNNQIKDISILKNLNNLKELYLWVNEIEDISVLKNLTDLNILIISSNKVSDISVLKYLKNLERLGINNLLLKSDQIQYIKLLNNLKTLWCEKGFKDISVLKQLNSNIKLW